MEIQSYHFGSASLHGTNMDWSTVTHTDILGPSCKVEVPA